MTLPKTGDRIRLIQMDDDPDPIPPGTTGTVLSVVEMRLPHPAFEGAHQVMVKWDIPRSLGLCLPQDKIEIIG